MSNEQDTPEWQMAREEAIRSIKVKNLPHIGPAPIGRWTGIGIGRKIVMDALGLSGDEAAALLGEHIGRSVPFRFAEWKVTASLKLEGFSAQPMVPLRGTAGAPSFSLDMFRMLFFWKSEIDNLQWSAGTFGGLTGGKWRHLLSGQSATIHEFTVHGTVVDELALVRSLGIPHDERAIILPAQPSNTQDEMVVTMPPTEPKWNWEGALIDLVAFASASDDGLLAIDGFNPPADGSQARLVEWFENWFRSNHVPDRRGRETPSEESIKTRARKVIVALAAERERAKAQKSAV